jgi:hypothetical protein
MRLSLPLNNIFILGVQNGKPLMLELITVYSRCVGSVEQRTLLRRGFLFLLQLAKIKKNIFAVLNWPDALFTEVKDLSCKMV